MNCHTHCPEGVELYNKQLKLGQIAGADVVQQQAALSLSQQQLPPLEKQLAQQRNLPPVAQAGEGRRGDP